VSQRNSGSIKCSGCGTVFSVGGAAGRPLAVADRPVSGGGIPDGNAMGAEGVVIAVVAKGPDNLPAGRDGWSAYSCPHCGRTN